MLTIDGVVYDVKVDVRRTAEMTASDISGLMMDKSYFNDVLGTYLVKLSALELTEDAHLEAASLLKAIGDMERIGDQAGDIAEIMAQLGDHDTQSRLHIQDMARAAVKMVTDAVDAFVKKDLELARSVMKYDDVVDDLFDQVKTELIGLIGEDTHNGECCIDLLMIAKYLERIGDHATNIAEWVEFSITGQHVVAEEER